MRSFAPLVLLALAPVAVSAPVPKAVKKGDTAAIVGIWKVTELTENGRDSRITYDTFVFDTAGVVTLRGNTKDIYSPQWTFTLDPKANPRRMSWSSLKGRTDWELVYALSGDTLKVGFIPKGKQAPAAVEPGDGLTLYVMTRDTSSK